MSAYAVISPASAAAGVDGSVVVILVVFTAWALRYLRDAKQQLAASGITVRLPSGAVVFVPQ